MFYLQETTPSLVRRPHPVFKTELGLIKAFPAHQLSFENWLCIPSIESKDHKDFGLNFVNDEGKLYGELSSVGYEDPLHFLLGYPLHIQNYIEADCVTFSKQNHFIPLEEKPLPFKVEMKNWQFLFQIDSDDSLEMMWGDIGTLYICLRKDDLMAKRFDKAWVVMQDC